MLKISKSSWHFRAMSWMYAHSLMHPREARSVCSYFWRALLSPLAPIASVLLIGAFAISVLVIMAGAVGGPLLMWLKPGMDTVIWGGLWLIGGLLTDIAVGRALLEALRPETAQRLNSVTRISIAYLAAKKRRVCPLVEYED
jgi:hypothetical protein